MAGIAVTEIKTALPSEGQRLSRHYYDVATMATTTFANRAINDMALFKNVIDHAQMLYRRSWMKLDEIKTEGIKLIPQDELHKNLETDYNLMKGMLFGEKPSFSSLMERIKVLENNFNEHILGETNSMEVPAEIPWRLCRDSFPMNSLNDSTLYSSRVDQSGSWASARLASPGPTSVSILPLAAPHQSWHRIRSFPDTLG